MDMMMTMMMIMMMTPIIRILQPLLLSNKLVDFHEIYCKMFNDLSCKVHVQVCDPFPVIYKCVKLFDIVYKESYSTK